MIQVYCRSDSCETIGSYLYSVSLAPAIASGTPAINKTEVCYTKSYVERKVLIERWLKTTGEVTIYQ